MRRKSMKAYYFSSTALPLILAAGGVAIAMAGAAPSAEAALSEQNVPIAKSATPSPNPRAVKGGKMLAGCTPCTPCNPCNPCKPTGSCFDPEEGNSVPC